MIAAVLTTALAYMSDDMVKVAIPSLAKDRGGTVTDVQWIVDSYYVVLVALVLVVGQSATSSGIDGSSLPACPCSPSEPSCAPSLTGSLC